MRALLNHFVFVRVITSLETITLLQAITIFCIKNKSLVPHKLLIKRVVNQLVYAQYTTIVQFIIVIVLQYITHFGTV